MAPEKPGAVSSNARVRKGGKRMTVVEAEVAALAVELATGTYTSVG